MLEAKQPGKRTYEARWNHMFAVLERGIAAKAPFNIESWCDCASHLLSQDPWFRRRGFQIRGETFWIRDSKAGGGFEALAEFFLPQPPDFYSRGSLYALFIGTPGLYKKAVADITLEDFLVRAREVHGRVFAPRQESRR